MKTAKKLFSLLLVAVLLMSAIPFQADATSNQKYVINFFPNEADDNHQQVELTNLTLTADMIPAPVSAGTEFSRWAVGSRTGGTFVMPANGVRTFVDTDFGISEGIKYINVYAVFAHTHKFEDSDTAAKQDPTCLVGGYKTQVCSCNATQPVTLDALGHDFSGKIHAATYVAATCETKGSEVFKCSRCDATTSPVEIPALGHDWGEWIVTTTPTTDAAGVQTRTCQTLGCGKTETAPVSKEAMVVTLEETEGSSANQTVRLTKGQAVVDLPKLADLPGRRFVGWFSQKNYGGVELVAGETYDGLYTTYYARYADSVNSTASVVTVYARFYSGGIKQSEKYLGELTVTKYDTLLKHLTANRETLENRIFDNAIYSAKDYEVKEGFYMNVNDNVVTNSTQVIEGNTSVYIRVNAKNSAEANVLLYIHNKAGEAAIRLFDMPGYVAKNNVTTTAVQSFLKAQTGKTYTVTGMYNQDAWDQLVAGYKTDAVSTLTVPDSGTLRIHVVLSNYSSGSTSNKPASNPATGDTIMITAGVMALSAAAFVTLTQLRKRKMI